jgi:hypothetical protein
MARLDVGKDGSFISIKIKDYAYTSRPNHPIFAGQTCPPQANVIANGPTTFCAGDSVILSSANTGTKLSYKWTLNGNTITGATRKRYPAKLAGDYQVIVTDTYHSCSRISAKRTVIVNCFPSNLAVSDEKLISKAPHLQITPNPFSNSTIVSFSIPQSTKVSISIFDAAGRLTKVLGDAQMQAGAHELVWNATDEKGNSVNAGIYFLKMQTESYSETRKLVVVK